MFLRPSLALGCSPAWAYLSLNVHALVPIILSVECWAQSVYNSITVVMVMTFFVVVIIIHYCYRGLILLPKQNKNGWMIIELNCPRISLGLVASVPLFGDTNQAAVTSRKLWKGRNWFSEPTTRSEQLRYYATLCHGIFKDYPYSKKEKEKQTNKQRQFWFSDALTSS